MFIAVIIIHLQIGPRSIQPVNSPYWLTYISLIVSNENLVVDQDIDCQFDYYFILVTPVN